MRARTESALVLVTCALVGAFIASFALGMLRDDATSGDVPPTPIADPPPAAPPDMQIREAAARVEVLNASGMSGLARRATEALRVAGFDVVYFGNAGEAAMALADSGSIVIDRIDDPARAQAVARALGITRVVSTSDSTLLLDATVLLGRDWPQRPDTTGR